jgi:hypothetical protein
MIHWLLSLHVVELYAYLIIFSALVWFGVLAVLYLAAQYPTWRPALPAWRPTAGAWRPSVRAALRRYRYRGRRRPARW